MISRVLARIQKVLSGGQTFSAQTDQSFRWMHMLTRTFFWTPPQKMILIVYSINIRE